jgi:hypothetical protein
MCFLESDPKKRQTISAKIPELSASKNEWGVSLVVDIVGEMPSNSLSVF